MADKAIGYARRAGDRAATQLAYEEAVRLYEMALTLVHEPIARCELLLALGDAQARAGDMRAAKDTFHEAAELAERHDLPEHLARAALGYGGRIIWEVSRDDPRLTSRCSSGPWPRSDARTARCASGCSPASPAARFATPASHRSAERP